MKIKEGFIKSEVLGQAVVVATKTATDKFNMLKLNDTAADIWDGISDGKNVSDIVETLISSYNISRESATQDVNALVDKLKDLGIVDEN